MGDFNAKIAQGWHLVGIYDFVVGDRILVITDALFKLPQQKLYMWRSQLELNGTEWIRNQINYILSSKQFYQIGHWGRHWF